MALVLVEPSTEQSEKKESAARVILYNDDWHTFDEVIQQLMKAIRCSAEEAQRHAWRVHTEGRSHVYSGHREECERVAGVLREVRLQVEVDWD